MLAQKLTCGCQFVSHTSMKGNYIRATRVLQTAFDERKLSKSLCMLLPLKRYEFSLRHGRRVGFMKASWFGGANGGWEASILSGFCFLIPRFSLERQANIRKIPTIGFVCVLSGLNMLHFAAWDWEPLCGVHLQQWMAVRCLDMVQPICLVCQFYIFFLQILNF